MTKVNIKEIIETSIAELEAERRSWREENRRFLEGRFDLSKAFNAASASGLLEGLEALEKKSDFRFRFSFEKAHEPGALEINTNLKNYHSIIVKGNGEIKAIAKASSRSNGMGQWSAGGRSEINGVAEALKFITKKVLFGGFAY